MVISWYHQQQPPAARPPIPLIPKCAMYSSIPAPATKEICNAHNQNSQDMQAECSLTHDSLSRSLVFLVDLAVPI